MRIIRCKDYAGLSKTAACHIAAQIIIKPDCVLGLATGTTPIGTYQNLIAMHREKELSFANVKTINLDEYVGLNADHVQSYNYFMRTQLFNYLDIDLTHTHLPNGCAKDLNAEGERYDALIQSYGGVDLHLLGLGHNGHIGFNEPDDCFSTGTHEVELTASTVEANSRLFDDINLVPRRAVTMGIGSIFAAKRILMTVSGIDKAEILRAALYGPITPQVPASILQLHPDVTIVADAEAATLI